MKRLLCYAHFDGNGQVKPFVKHALNAMQPHCLKTIFVSNSAIADDDRVELLSVCSDVLVNDNTGYDFYMWKLALEKADLSLYDEVVLMNSSIYGPVSDIGAAFNDMAELECDFWGITECFQMQPHIQSYFLVFRRRVLESQVFRHFWDGVLPYTNKLQVIQSYEVGLTQWLVETGFNPGVLCSFEELGRYCQTAGKRLRKKDNASVKHALELLSIGNPFLKRDAVRNRKVDMAQVLPFLQKHAYPVALINEQMQQVEKHCPLCGAAGAICRKGVKDYLRLHSVERYNYFKCKSSACGIVWLDGVALNTTAVAHPQSQSSKNTPKIKLPAVPKSRSLDNTLILGWDNDISWSKLNETGEKIMLQASSKGEALYDSIVVTNGFERSADPIKKLTEYFSLLKPGGALYLQTVNIKSPLSYLFNIYWYGLNAPKNKIFFNRKALKNVLSRSGFVDVKVTADTALTHEYAQHSFNIIRNKWTSKNYVVPANWGAVLLNRCVWLASFIFVGCGEELVGAARKPM